MSVLRISLFGGVRIEHEGRPKAEKVTRAVEALLAYLLLQRQRSHSREALCGLFWGDHSDESARGCLNTTLWRLRRVLEPDGVGRGTYLINTAQGGVAFNPDSTVWFDVSVLERAAERVFSEPAAAVRETDVQELEAALELYTGDLLEGHYGDWALRERERLRGLYLNSLARLMRYHKDHSAYEKSVACGEQILRLDPLREEIHREMIRLHLQSGRRALALRQYEICREMLASELRVDPMEETQALFAQIAPPVPERHRSGGKRNSIAIADGVAEALRQAMQGLDHVRERFQHALQLIDDEFAGKGERKR